MKQLIKISNEIELLSEDSDGFLVSGFSTAFKSKDMMYGGVEGGGTNVAGHCGGTTNNCQGGNCVAGCSNKNASPVGA